MGEEGEGELDGEHREKGECKWKKTFQIDKDKDKDRSKMKRCR